MSLIVSLICKLPPDASKGAATRRIFRADAAAAVPPAPARPSLFCSLITGPVCFTGRCRLHFFFFIVFTQFTIALFAPR